MIWWCKIIKKTVVENYFMDIFAFNTKNITCLSDTQLKYKSQLYCNKIVGFFVRFNMYYSLTFSFSGSGADDLFSFLGCFE